MDTNQIDTNPEDTSQEENEQYLMKEILKPEDFTGPLGKERYDLLAKIAIRFRNLIEDLDSRDSDIRQSAIRTLAKYGDRHVMNYLKVIQRDDKSVLRYFARQEIEKIRKTLDLLPPVEPMKTRQSQGIKYYLALLVARTTPGSLFMCGIVAIIFWIIIFTIVYLN
ncbi:MAG: hypothetical protein QGH40_15020 [bacterium]|nr:hypothetical protein [bacterium]